MIKTLLSQCNITSKMEPKKKLSDTEIKKIVNEYPELYKPVQVFNAEIYEGMRVALIVIDSMKLVKQGDIQLIFYYDEETKKSPMAILLYDYNTGGSIMYYLKFYYVLSFTKIDKKSQTLLEFIRDR